MNKVWNVGIYVRVSTDKKIQSESIPSQIENLKKWLELKGKEDKNNKYNLIEIYKDKGVSGSTFDRESFKNLKQDIDDNKINMVLTRDLSRFSRNYILAGYYLEEYFKIREIRFVSVLDNVDTENEFDDIIPFKNILNEMYIKDCSKRVKSALKERMIRGSSIASKPPYGYKFLEYYNGDVKTIKLVPANDETTEVVKEIFNLYLDGYGLTKIAECLNAQGIEPPSARLANFKNKLTTKWNKNTISSILKNPKYGGIMVQQRWKKVSYKTKKVKRTSKEEWVYGGEFKGIVDKETFYRVQQLIIKRGKNYRYKNGIVHPFSTVLKCNECGGKMTYRINYKGYKCTNSQRGGGICTAHSIKEAFLDQLIQIKLKESFYNKFNREDYYKKIDKVNLKTSLYRELMLIEKQLIKLEKSLEELYKDKVNGIITEKNFKILLYKIQDNQSKMENKKNKIVEVINKNSNSNEIKKLYKHEIDKILNVEQIDRSFVEYFIEKIIVIENKVSREKALKIYFRFKK